MQAEDKITARCTRVSKSLPIVQMLKFYNLQLLHRFKTQLEKLHSKKIQIRILEPPLLYKKSVGLKLVEAQA